MSCEKLEAAAEAYVEAADAYCPPQGAEYARFQVQTALNFNEYQELICSHAQRQSLAAERQARALEAIATALAFLCGGLEREISGFARGATANDALLKILVPQVVEAMKHD